MKAIIAKELSINFGKKYAMPNINIEVNEGEFLGLVGNNGVGKTTLLRLICGLLKPSSGDAYIFGRSTRNIKDINHLVGMVPQTNVISENLTVLEYLTSEAHLRGLHESVVATSLSLVNSSDVADRKIKDLSIGSKRKILIARALMHGPRILLMDEPSAGLDPIIRRSIWEYLINLKKQNIAGVISTHSLDEVSFLCDKVLLMQKRNNSLESKLVDLTMNYSNEILIELTGIGNCVNAFLTNIGNLCENACISKNNIILQIHGDPYPKLHPILQQLLDHDIRFKAIRLNNSHINDVFEDFYSLQKKETIA